MKRAIATDFAVVGDKLALMALVSIAVGIFMAISMETPLLAGSVIGIFLPYTLLVRLWVSDDANTWGSFRLTLPQSRRVIITGRYLEILLAMLASMAIGSLAAWAYILLEVPLGLSSTAFEAPAGFPGPLSLSILMSAFSSLLAGLSAAISIPAFAAKGATGAVAFIPMVTLLLFGLLASGVSTLLIPRLEGLEARGAFATPAGLLLTVLGAFAILVLALLAVSRAIAVRFYEAREF